MADHVSPTVKLTNLCVSVSGLIGWFLDYCSAAQAARLHLSGNACFTTVLLRGIVGFGLVQIDG